MTKIFSNLVKNINLEAYKTQCWEEKSSSAFQYSSAWIIIKLTQDRLAGEKQIKIE